VSVIIVTGVGVIHAGLPDQGYFPLYLFNVDPHGSQTGKTVMHFLDAGCWILDSGCWMLDSGFWILETSD
jgi:hypothetical protein